MSAAVPARCAVLLAIGLRCLATTQAALYEAPVNLLVLAHSPAAAVVLRSQSGGQVWMPVIERVWRSRTLRRGSGCEGRAPAEGGDS